MTWRNMKIRRLSTPILITITTIAAVSFIIPHAMAKGTPFQAGYDHGCSDAKLTFSKRYINQLGKGPNFHTIEFMKGYNAGLEACNKPSPIHSSIFYKQGYAKGILDAKSYQKTFTASNAMRPEDVDCDSDIDPQTTNADYCSGYQHGFADANNNNAPPTTMTISQPPIAKSPPPVLSTEPAQALQTPSKVCLDGSVSHANSNCPLATQAPAGQGTITQSLSAVNDNPKHHEARSDLIQPSPRNEDNNNPSSPSGDSNNNDNKKLGNHGKVGEASTPQLSKDKGTQ
jgi:hypothetical protein